jgi:hemerythrin-like domain-containing protein
MPSPSLPGAPAPAAGFDQPFELLAACHDRVRQRLDLLARLIAHVKAQGADPAGRAAAADVLRYFDLAAPHHHEDEERHLVPLLAASDDPAHREAAHRLLADHVALRAAWQALRPLLQRLDAAEYGLLAAAAQHFIDLHGPHLALEDALVYPTAAQHIDTATEAAMGREMAARRGAPAP